MPAAVKLMRPFQDTVQKASSVYEIYTRWFSWPINGFQLGLIQQPHFSDHGLEKSYYELNLHQTISNNVQYLT